VSQPARDPAPWREGDAFLDLRGELCPFTFVRTKLEMEELPVGARLRVAVDNAQAAVNVPRSAAAWGQGVLDVVERDGVWHLDLVKLRD
jgi:tRNA 2-thiouridine synthesizing protein A